VKQLLAFRGFPHNPQGVLAAVCQLALMRVELCLNMGLCGRKARLELSVAPLAYADGGRHSFYDPQFALLHDSSLAHQAGRA
jgi:hypothetical protein